MTKKKKVELPRIGITMGDPAGIGPEIILKLFSEENLFKFCQPVVIGDYGFLKRLKKDLSFSVELKLFEEKGMEKSLEVIDLKNVDLRRFVRGKESKAGGRAAAEYIKMGAELAMKKKIAALVTCPINKKSLHLAGFFYPGHTEFLASLTGTKNFAMMLVGRGLRVILITTHIPISQVTKMITKKEIVRIICLAASSLKSFGIRSPKLAVTGLNPHAGDKGVIGREEGRVILPAIEAARRRGVKVEGPFPADTVFTENIRKKYSAIITMYHDQALIPLKMLSFGEGVNITLGLPIIRTSVDHGTAFDIVGTGTAGTLSLKEAIMAAVNIRKKEFA